MSATGLTTTAMKNLTANAYAGAALYLTLLQPVTLQTAVTAGATTFSVDLAVQAGDLVVFDAGLTTEEIVTVASVSGSGPYTVTPTAPLVKAHGLTGANAGMEAHIPVSGTTVHEVSGLTRVAASWSSASNGAVTSAASAITVPSGAKVGAVAVFSASTSGTYYDAGAIPAQNYPASAAYTPVWVETFS